MEVFLEPIVLPFGKNKYINNEIFSIFSSQNKSFHTLVPSESFRYERKTSKSHSDRMNFQ